MHFYDFWMIQHEQYLRQAVVSIYNYLDMQYEVHPTNQTQEIDPKLKGSFKNFYVSYEKNR